MRRFTLKSEQDRRRPCWAELAKGIAIGSGSFSECEREREREGVIHSRQE